MIDLYDMGKVMRGKFPQRSKDKEFEEQQKTALAEATDVLECAGLVYFRQFRRSLDERRDSLIAEMKGSDPIEAGRLQELLRLASLIDHDIEAARGLINED